VAKAGYNVAAAIASWRKANLGESWQYEINENISIRRKLASENMKRNNEAAMYNIEKYWHHNERKYNTKIIFDIIAKWRYRNRKKKHGVFQW